MSAQSPSASTVAVLVVTDGESWLAEVLACLGRQDLSDFAVVAVDNASTDRSGEMLARALPEDHIVRLPRRTGFGRAVAAAIARSGVASRASRVLLVHDDLLLAPDAAERLVAALDANPRAGAVGPKLLEWSEEPILSEVGLTTDRLGRAESPLEAGEVDQGQHDHRSEVFYVSTAGMMLRREMLADVGGFDARYPLFRDDLDLCWRAQLAGWDVEVVPAAVGYHLGAAAHGLRDLGRRARPREYAERHVLATLLKTYRLPTLLWVVPLLAGIASGKVLVFIASRHVAEAGAVARAYLWAAVQLPRTLPRRRRTQSRRRRTDVEIRALQASGLPRLRTYGEAVGNWLAGGSARALLDEEGRAPAIEDVDAGGMVRRALRRPVALAGVGLGVVYLAGVAKLLGSGPIRGGQVDPWPDSIGAFLTASVTPLESAPLAIGTVGSPGPMILGLLSAAGFGDAWLAQRLLVLGALPLAWLAAVRAGRWLTDRPAPRVVGASLYVLSPAVLGTLAGGAVDVLAFAVLLPMQVSLAVRAGHPDLARDAAWRAGALLTLCTAILGALAPAALPVVGLLVVLVAVATGAAGGGWRSVQRLLVATGVGLAPLAPWLAGLVRAGWTDAVPGSPSSPLEWWRALAAVPADAPVAVGVPGVVTAAAVAAVVLGAVWLGWHSRPLTVAAFALVAVTAGGSAWLLARIGVDLVSVPSLLVVVALALAALGVLAVRWATDRLSRHGFGFRHIATGLLAACVLAGVGVGVWRLGDGAAEGLDREVDPVPAFVRGDVGTVGPYRVLLVDQDAEHGSDTLRWEVVEANGPAMTRYGAAPDLTLVRRLDAAVAAIAAGTDPRGGGLLGTANVRYVVAGEIPDELAAAVDRQPDLEPVPAGDARVWQVTSWLPRAVVRPPAAARDALAGDPGDARDAETEGLLHVAAGRWAGETVPADGGALLLAESDADRWTAVGDGRELEALDAPVGAAFAVPAGTRRVAAVHDGGALAWLSPLLLAAVLLGTASVALRPPGAGRRRAQRPAAAAAVPVPPVEAASLPSNALIGPQPLGDEARHEGPAEPESPPDQAAGAPGGPEPEAPRPPVGNGRTRRPPITERPRPAPSGSDRRPTGGRAARRTRRSP